MCDNAVENNQAGPDDATNENGLDAFIACAECHRFDAARRRLALCTGERPARLSLLALENMRFMLVTLSTLQSPSRLLNDLADWNIEFIDVTLEVSHAVMSSLKYNAAEL